MKLISVYDVVRDATFLVESKDGSLIELKRAIQERCIPWYRRSDRSVTSRSPIVVQSPGIEGEANSMLEESFQIDSSCE